MHFLNIRLLKVFLPLVSFALLTACDDTIDDLINEYNYIRLVPASNVYGPGDLIAREKYNSRTRNPSKTAVTSLCISKYATGKYQKQTNNFPKESRTESRRIARQLSGKATISIDQLRAIADIELNPSAVKKVVADVSDVSVLIYSQEDLIRIQKILGPECKRIVNKEVGDRNAYQIRETLVATVSFEVQLEIGISAQARASVIKELVSAGASLSSENNYAVNGEALVYGIRWEEIETRI